MPNLLAPIHAQVQAQHPGAKVHRRGYDHIHYALGGNQYQFVTVGGGVGRFADAPLVANACAADSGGQERTNMERLMHSSKFWTAMIDALGSTVLLLGGRFLAPQDVDLIKALVITYQPVFLTVIAAIAVEDAATARAQVDANLQRAAGK